MTHHRQCVDDLNGQVLLWAHQGCLSGVGNVVQLLLFFRSILGMPSIPLLKSSMSAGLAVTSTMCVQSAFAEMVDLALQMCWKGGTPFDVCLLVCQRRTEATGWDHSTGKILAW